MFRAIGFNVSNWQKVQYSTDLFVDTQGKGVRL